MNRLEAIDLAASAPCCATDGCAPASAIAVVGREASNAEGCACC